MSKFLLRSALGTVVPHRKNTADMQTVCMPLPGRVILPVAQHIGAPAVPVVAKGSHVDVGTLVAQAAGWVSANIHSGVSGTVREIAPLMMPNGAEVPAIVIEPDGAQTVDTAVCPPAVTDAASFVEAVRASGLVGLGGAGFPTHVKLSPPEKAELRYLLINGAECEPYITADDRTLLEEGEDVCEGIRLVQKYLGIRKALICIERNKQAAIDHMFELTAREPDMEVRPLPSRYPQGAEKVLIERVTGREVPAGGLPADAGVLVLNATTAAFLARYLRTGMPLVTRRLTVDGDAVARRQNVEVIIGTPLQEVLDFCGGLAEDTGKVLTGGPMMGIAMASTAFPVLKQNNAVLAFREASSHLPAPQPCIHCGRCVNDCPVGLSPVQLAGAYRRQAVDELARLHAELCIECGTCSYVCPAMRPVTQSVRLAKGLLRQKGGKK